MNTLIIRADATSEGGTGHVMRCLALAQAWQDKGGEVGFISHCGSDALKNRITAEGINLISLDKPHPDPFDWNLTRGILDKLKTRGPKSHPWLVVDGYHFDSGYQKSIKAAGYKLLWIDDYGHATHYYADLILNQNISADPALYIKREPYTNLLLGTRYVLLRREFKRWQGWQREIPAIARKVLVTLGGGDPDNVTSKVMQTLGQVELEGLEVQAVVGASNPHHQDLYSAGRQLPYPLRLEQNVTNMPELMAWADLAITAGGSTCWELAFMGLPNIIVVLADNQRPIAESLVARGISVNLGWHQDFSSLQLQQSVNLLLAAAERVARSLRGRELVDGDGSCRVVALMQGQRD